MNTNPMNTNSDQSVKTANAGLEVAKASFETSFEADLAQALRNFRASVHAWSNAELSRPRAIALAAHRHSWRFAAGWALGCLLAAGSLSAGLYQHHRNQTLVRMAYERQIEQQQFHARQSAVSAQAGQGDASLMAAVDSDVSRPVPSAMEPLAQLMDESPDQ